MTTCKKCGDPKVKARGLCKRDYEAWLKANPERAWKKAAYPSNEGMLELATEFCTLREVAESLGIRRESLRDYLNRRPKLKAGMQTILDGNKTHVDPRESRAKWRAAHPDKVRDINRRWARNQDPAKRARWNSYNRERRRRSDALIMTEMDLEFATVLRLDPCAYCGGRRRPTIDHIIPIAAGGTSEWVNLSAACHSCNSSKNDTMLLEFMLRTRAKAKALPNKGKK